MSLIITNAYLLQEPFEDQPLNHARIGYRTLWRAEGSTVTASSEQEGFPVSASLNELTYEFWRPESLPATWELNLSSPRNADYLGIASHTLKGLNIILEYDNNGVWEEITQFTPDENDPIMVLFEQVETTKFRLTINGSEIPSIGVIFIGQTLQMLRPIYGGHSPIKLSRSTEIEPNRSERGQWLGRSLVRKGVSASYSWDNLSDIWYRNFFDPFVEYATQSRGTFFIAWRPGKYPKEVGYCWTLSDIEPVNTGVRNLMSVEMDVVGQIDFETPKVSDYA